jgi:hypothetical protein
MAKPTAPTDLPDIIIEDYTPPAPTKPEDKPGPYDRWIVAGLDADAALAKEDPDAYQGGKRKRVSIVVPNGDPKEIDGETTFPAVEKERRLFQDSARYRDRTAKVVATDDQGDGYTKVSFILIPKQVRPRLTPEEKAAREAEAAKSGETAPEADAA